MPSVTKLKVVPLRWTTGSRPWWVRMKPGLRNGGSSPPQPPAFGSCSHGPSPPLNLFRPITVAPVRSKDSRRASSSGPVAPPSRPWVARQLARPKIHSCRRSPPSPSGSSSVALGPATNPSSDIEISNLTIVIVSLLSLVVGYDRGERANSSRRKRLELEAVQAKPRFLRHHRPVGLVEARVEIPARQNGPGPARAEPRPRRRSCVGRLDPILAVDPVANQ